MKRIVSDLLRLQLAMRLTVLACYFLFPLLAHASSAVMDGHDMLRKCRLLWSDSGAHFSTQEMMDSMFCDGYILGVLDSHAMIFAIDKVDQVKTIDAYCKPAEVSDDQVFFVLKKWLDNNPEELHWRGDTIIYSAMLKAFPCK